ncbi:hypothetical protein NQ317_008126 [Molorchus minor]|uniref:Uncharacterized protein n=1 Tax=Molorchus minor TaxID=1323400 RepID=A0ABQ9IYV1_9CUCU|nr:hypothetical protein NQ317_008126 [Molorchus minor]
MQPEQDELQCVQVGISVFPTKPPPPPPPPPKIPAKLRALLKKYKYNWRLDMLSKPKPPITSKFVAEIVKPRYDKKKEVELIDETTYFSDHMSRPLVRTLVINKNQWGRQNGLKYRKGIRKRIAKSWASIYNYYKYKERDRKAKETENGTDYRQEKRRRHRKRLRELKTWLNQKKL